jgi:predicted dehydrogenase
MARFQGSCDWPNNVLSLDTSPDGIAAALRNGPYGRCVYACDNDVVDRQVVNLEFEGGLVASFTMTGFNEAQFRETWIMGTHGMLRGDGRRIVWTNFINNEVKTIDRDAEGMPLEGGHSGADAAIVREFLRAVAEEDPSRMLTSAAESLESHLMAFAAERARKRGSVESIG